MKRRLLIQWDSTNRCNLKCSHCYHNAEGNSSHFANPFEMMLDDVRSMLEDLINTSNKWHMTPQLNISGGEPLMREDLYQILKLIKRKKIACKLLTNGTLITSEVARDLYSLGIRALQISLDGAKNRHNKLRGADFAYDKAIEGIENSSNVGIKVNVSMTALKSNTSDFEDVIVNAINAGAKYVGFQSYVPDNQLGKNDPEYLGPQETYSLFLETQKLADKYKDEIKVLQTEVLWQILEDDNYFKKRSREEMKHLMGCSAGYFALSVLTDGRVYPCRRLPLEIGRINEGIERLISENNVMKNLRDLHKLKRNSACDLVTHCRGCRAVAYAVTGSYTAKDPTCFRELISNDKYN